MSETAQVIPPFIKRQARASWPPDATRPSAREWARCAFLFLLTTSTATIAGVTQATNFDGIEPSLVAPSRPLDHLLFPAKYYLLTVLALIGNAFAHPMLLAQGATFAASLLAILLAHESGHYFACRRYGVRATLPFFLPAPPLFLSGTFGAFIKIKSSIPTRRALFDIGVAGPLAGFVVIIPVAVAAILTAHPAPPIADAGVGIVLNDPPLLRLIARACGMRLSNVAPNPFYWAAWIGLLVTSLNLLPVGQLDGGHAVFSVCGARAHKWIGRSAFVAMSVVAVLGWAWHGSPGGFVYVALLFIMLRVRHPQADDETQTLGRARTLVALLTFVVFLLCFELFPLTIT